MHNMELYIIRHGQSTNNALGADVTKRVMDAPLTELGLKQAELVATYLAKGLHSERISSTLTETGDVEQQRGYGITRLYCSAMHRALQTARPISKALGLTPEIWVDIHEQGGIYLDDPTSGKPVGYPGMTRIEIQEMFNDYVLPDEVTEQGWWLGGFETLSMCQGRAIRVSEQLRQWAEPTGTPLDRSMEHIAIVSHGTFLGMLIKALLNQLPGNGIYYHQYNTAMTHFTLRPGGGLELHYLNRTDHLP